MCGINGIIKLDSTAFNEPDVRKMMFAQKHRGPDDEGIFLKNNVGLGFVRLSIIDLTAAGHQPFISEDHRYSLIFNGEIYNYIEIREELMVLGYQFTSQSDTEVVLKSYIEWGELAFHKFRGMWALAIYDDLDKSVFLCRDRFGIKPLYYYVEEETFYFASEIRAILAIKSLKNEANQAVIFDYLIFNKTEHNENTFYKGIKKLMHGHSLKIDLKNTHEIPEIHPLRWYDLEKEVEKNSGFRSAQEYLLALKDSMSMHLRSDVPIGVSFSGGIDSSAITSFAKIQIGGKLKTFSAVYSSEFKDDETKFINLHEEVEKNFVFPQAELFLEELPLFFASHSEPMPSTSPYAQFKLMQEASKHVKVMLDGQGADEQLAGYHYFFGFYFKDLFLKGKLLTFLKETFYYLKIHKSLFALKSFAFFFISNKSRTSFKVNEFNNYSKRFIESNIKNSDISNDLYSSKTLKKALLNHFEYKLEHLLKWEERNSMCFSIEARVPFLDHILVEKTIATESKFLIQKGQTKFILRDALKGIIPEKIRTRKDKIGFTTPQDDWFRNSRWEKFIWEIILSESFENRKIFDTKQVKANFQSHLEGKINISREIWKWINIELWYREYIDCK